MNNQDNEKVFQKSQINWYPGHMSKTKRQIKEQLNIIDIVYEVIDARMPLSSKIKDIDDLLKDKPKVLVVTKMDLCDEEETNKILSYYKNNNYQVVSLDLINDSCSKLINVTNQIMNHINDVRLSKGLKKRSARVLVVGAPNVGKSTLINKLVGRKSAGVANKPGFTKSLSWIRINKDIELLDSPGILWPKLDNQYQAHVLAAFQSIKEEILNKDDIAIFIIKTLYNLYPNLLNDRYNITEIDEDYVEVYEMIGRKRGAMSRGGIVDYERVSDIIIKDLINGYIGKVTFDRLDKFN